MRRVILALLVLAVPGGYSAAWAQESSGESSGVTTKKAEEVTETGLKDEIVGVRPQLGILAYNDSRGDATSRFAVGITADMNIMSYIDENLKNWYVGPSVGFIYSHLGNPDSNFFGSDSSVSGPGGGANLFYFPVNLKAGYTFGSDVRASIHGGGNVIHRSVANSLLLGSSSSTGIDSDTTMYPNVGADFEFNLGRNMSLMVRPDLTITPGDEFFTGTLALAILLS